MDESTRGERLLTIRIPPDLMEQVFGAIEISADFQESRGRWTHAAELRALVLNLAAVVGDVSQQQGLD